MVAELLPFEVLILPRSFLAFCIVYLCTLRVGQGWSLFLTFPTCKTVLYPFVFLVFATLWYAQIVFHHPQDSYSNVWVSSVFVHECVYCGHKFIQFVQRCCTLQFAPYRSLQDHILNIFSTCLWVVNFNCNACIFIFFKKKMLFITFKTSFIKGIYACFQSKFIKTFLYVQSLSLNNLLCPAQIYCLYNSYSFLHLH